MDEKLCAERHKGVNARLDSHSTDIKNVEFILHGNGKDGLIAKVNAMYSWYQKKIATQAGLLDWAFRLMITIVLGYIATKVGLK